MQVLPYLQRLGISTVPEPDLAALATLQQAHLRQVPFENLSIHWGEPIELSLPALYRKVVERRRGGFCYELNSLFAGLLGELGFRVSLLAAEVARSGGGFGPPFDHLALCVHLEEDWLVDVGFGDTFQQPLRLSDRQAQVQGARAYVLDLEGGEYTLRCVAPEPGVEYRFRPDAHPLEAFAPMSEYHQSSPDSHFTRKRICSRATPQGRVSLGEDRLILSSEGVREELPLESEAAWSEALLRHFGIRR